ncbi:MAG: hypothetical protein D8M22_09550 [Armatimonadetes bacterium]|nr:hypothetical protein [Armatimonadota bacterium]
MTSLGSGSLQPVVYKNSYLCRVIERTKKVSRFERDEIFQRGMKFCSSKWGHRFRRKQWWQ